jgi:hypothetical protein
MFLITVSIHVPFKPKHHLRPPHEATTTSKLHWEDLATCLMTLTRLRWVQVRQDHDTDVQLVTQPVSFGGDTCNLCIDL